MEDIFVVEAVRTPIGSFCGSLSSLKAHELGILVVQECLKRSNIQKDCVSRVIMGQTLTAGQGQNPARQTSVGGGLPYSVPAFTVNELCGSGLKSIGLGWESIRCGNSDVVICGGQESMSQSPHCILMRDSKKMGDMSLTDTLMWDGLTDAFNRVHMGNTAENVAHIYGITREEQDAFALNSQQKVASAVSSGAFDKEIITVTIKAGNKVTLVEKDEYPRPDTSIEKLAKLKPVFKKEGGSVTAGNASGINDGAAAVLLMSASAVSKHSVKPMVKVLGYSEAGLDPMTMGLGPIPAIRSLLEKVGWTIESVDLFEINEAFSAQAIAVIRELKIPLEKINVCGGGVALGHPIGASGARILVTLVHTLLRTGKKRGIASLCVGGGMGIAMAVESCE